MEQQEEDKILRQYKTELIHELDSIVGYWISHTLDQKQGGFFGAIDNENIPDPLASKGIVLNSRILWMFSAAIQFRSSRMQTDG